MGEDRVEIRRFAAGLPSRTTLPRRVARGLYQDWQTFARLLGKANEEVIHERTVDHITALESVAI